MAPSTRSCHPRRNEPRPWTRNATQLLENRTHPSFWKVGHTGRKVSRRYALNSPDTPGRLADTVIGVHGGHCLRLSPEVYLLTYTMRYNDQVSRRSTIWRKGESGWSRLYHQVTPVLERF